jgi:hypothetical protein
VSLAVSSDLALCNFDPQKGQNLVPSGDSRPQLGFLQINTRFARQLGQNFAPSSFIGLPHFGHLFLNPFIADLIPVSTPLITVLSALHFKEFLIPEIMSSIIPIFL